MDSQQVCKYRRRNKLTVGSHKWIGLISHICLLCSRLILTSWLKLPDYTQVHQRISRTILLSSNWVLNKIFNIWHFDMHNIDFCGAFPWTKLLYLIHVWVTAFRFWKIHFTITQRHFKDWIASAMQLSVTAPSWYVDFCHVHMSFSIRHIAVQCNVT